MRNAPPSSPLRHLGVLGGIPLLALALGAGDVSAREPENLSGCGTSTPVHGPADSTRTRVPVRPTAAPAPERIVKRSRGPVPTRPSKGGEQRRGGVGMLIGITFA